MSITTLLNTITLPEMTDLIKRNWIENGNRVPTPALQLFIRSTAPAGTGEVKRFSEIDIDDFANNKGQGQNVSKGQLGTGYEKDMTVKRIGKEFDITYEMRKYNKYPEVQAILSGIVELAPQRIDLDATHRFTFASATSYVDMDGATVDVTMGDGLSMINNAHLLKYSASTYSNRLTGDPAFSKTALESAEELANTNVLDNLGQRRVYNFNTIITGDDPATVNTVKTYLESIADPTANQAGVVNVYKGKYRHVILPRLASTARGGYDSTKKRWWFLGAISGSAKGSLQAHYCEWDAPMLLTPEANPDLKDNHKDIWSYGVRAAYGLVIVSGRGIIGSLPVS